MNANDIIDMMIIALVFLIPAIVIIAVAGMSYYNKIQRMKIEAALREEEMRRGYMPGTYSRSFSTKQAYKEMRKENKRANKHVFSKEPQDEDNPEEMDREELERAISDLEKRINNLDTIMKERRNDK